ncbi:HAMP domain-containing histidine kinase [candidate division KSB1 bacterium]|nr:HAMP domain-containing histidine kinase [candidate division KSB1 bacterium]
MGHEKSLDNKHAASDKEALELRLKELFRNYEVSLDLIKNATNREQLIDRILEEYMKRLSEIPQTDLVAVAEADSFSIEKEKVQSMMMFAIQAVLLKENADLYVALDKKKQELESLRQHQERANKHLKQLNSHYLNILNFISHELKNPIISILGFAEFLVDNTLGDLKREQIEAVQIIIRVSKNLIDMINNYLELSKIENGELKIKLEPLNIQQDVFNFVIETLQEQLAQKRMQISSDAHFSEPNIIILGSRELLRSVVMNIFSNAIKFGIQGKAITYSICNKVHDIEFRIRNQSHGVKQADLDLIFRKFSQVHDERNQNEVRGTGLGLYLTKMIVEGHGGSIEAHSDGKSWFEIVLTLPKGGVAEDRIIRSNRDFYLDHWIEKSENEVQEVDKY